MFGISFNELVIIFLVLVIFFNTKDIVNLFVALHKMYQAIKHYSDKIYTEVQQLFVLNKFDQVVDIEKDDHKN